MLYHMEKKVAKDPKLKEAYTDFIAEYEELNRMLLATLNSHETDFNETFVLPHHGIWKKPSSTTKPRTVYNGSIRTEPGVSLNNLLHAGLNLLPSHIDSTRQRRRYKYVFVADVEKMFRNKEDYHFQSILCRSDSSKPIEIYRLITVT